MKCAWPYAAIDREEQKRLEITTCGKEGCPGRHASGKEWPSFNLIFRSAMTGHRIQEHSQNPGQAMEKLN